VLKTPTDSRYTEHKEFGFWFSQSHFNLKTAIVNKFVLPFGILFIWKWIILFHKD